MRASALQRKIDKDGIASDGGFTCFFGHQISQKVALAPAATGQLANTIGGTAIANSPNEVRTVLSTFKAHFQCKN
jgi:hypothetical protein